MNAVGMVTSRPGLMFGARDFEKFVFNGENLSLKKRMNLRAFCVVHS